MSDQDAAAYHEQRQQIDTIGWLQSYEQEEEDIQVDKKLQIGTSAYLVFNPAMMQWAALTMNSTSK